MSLVSHLPGRGRGLAWAAAAIVSLGVVACGDDDDTGGGATKSGGTASSEARTPAEDEAAIQKLLVTAFKSRDPALRCTRVFARDLFAQLFVSEEACRRVFALTGDDDDPPRRVEVSAIEVDGEGARASVKLVGGDTGGAAGGVTLVREDGRWRVEDLSLDYLRTALAAGFANQQSTPASVAGCIEKRLTRLPDARFKEFAYGAIGRKPDAQRTITAVYTACERATGRTPLIRRKLNTQVAKPLRENGATSKLIACVTKRLERTLSDKALITLAAKTPNEQRVELRQLVTQALSACGGLRGKGNVS